MQKKLSRNIFLYVQESAGFKFLLFFIPIGGTKLRNSFQSENFLPTISSKKNVWF